MNGGYISDYQVKTDIIGNQDIMINLTMSGICIYLCIAMSSLTLTASILALYILISLTNGKSETGQIGQTGQQEVRQREESSRPLCLATQL